MDSLRRRRVLRFGGVAGVAALAGCQGVIGFQDAEPPHDSADTLGLAIAKSGPSCLSTTEDAHSGWVHTVANGRTYAVTFDIRVSHARGGAVTMDLTSTPLPGEYILAIMTANQGEDTRKPIVPPNDPDCDVGTRVIGGGSVPLNFETLRVTMNGKTIQTVEREGTFPKLTPLPNPIEG